MRVAGFFAARAVWCVFDGETLIPILAFTDEAINYRLRQNSVRAKERLCCFAV